MQLFVVLLLLPVLTICTSLSFGSTIACRFMEQYPLQSGLNCNASCGARGRISGECVLRTLEGTNKKRHACICSKDELTTLPTIPPTENSEQPQTTVNNSDGNETTTTDTTEGENTSTIAEATPTSPGKSLLVPKIVVEPWSEMPPIDIDIWIDGKK